MKTKTSFNKSKMKQRARSLIVSKLIKSGMNPTSANELVVAYKNLKKNKSWELICDRIDSHIKSKTRRNKHDRQC